MDWNIAIQWVCVAVAFGVIVVWVVRYIIRMATWTRQMKKPGHGAGLPPCCDPSGAKKKPSLSSDVNKKPSQKPSGGLCDGCDSDCPLK